MTQSLALVLVVHGRGPLERHWMTAGMHFVCSKHAGKPAIWYIYAWRGGPRIHKSEGARPKITSEIIDALAEARRHKFHKKVHGLTGLIVALRASAEWAKLAPSTQANYRTWLNRIEDEFGDAELAAFDDRRMRGAILEWRDKFAKQPRSADLAMQTFSRVISFGFDRGWLTVNVLKGVAALYEVDRSNLIWEQAHFERFNASASIEVREGVELAAATGLRRGDLVKLPWAAIGEHAIIWKTSKSGGKTQIIIPLLPETKALFARIKERHAAEMVKLPEAKRKPLPATVLANSRWESWTPMGFGSRFNDAKKKAGIVLHLHDVRGTFATRLMLAGLTDQEIAGILGWESKDVGAIRVKYVSQARVIINLAERIAASSVEKPHDS